MPERRDPVSPANDPLVPVDPVSTPGDPPPARDPAPEEVPALGARDISRTRDRQASIVLTVAAAVSMFIWFPLGLVVGLVAAGYSYVSGARIAFWVALAVVLIALLSVVLGLTDFDGGAFQG
jgi:hypothetical protein